MLDRPILRGGIPRTRAVRVRAVHAGQNRPEHRAGRGGVRLKALARAAHQLFLGHELHGPAVPVTLLHVGISVDITSVIWLRIVGLAVIRGLGRGRGRADPRDRILAAHRDGEADLSVCEGRFDPNTVRIGHVCARVVAGHRQRGLFRCQNFIVCTLTAQCNGHRTAVFLHGHLRVELRGTAAVIIRQREGRKAQRQRQRQEKGK